MCSQRIGQAHSFQTHNILPLRRVQFHKIFISSKVHSPKILKQMIQHIFGMDICAISTTRYPLDNQDICLLQLSNIVYAHINMTYVLSNIPPIDQINNLVVFLSLTPYVAVPINQWRTNGYQQIVDMHNVLNTSHSCTYLSFSSSDTQSQNDMLPH